MVSLGHNELTHWGMPPSDTMCWHISKSTFAQMKAWCLTASSHYLNQCWLIISGVLWLAAESNFTGSAQEFNLWYELEYYAFKIIAISPKAQWVNDKYGGFALVQHWNKKVVTWTTWSNQPVPQSGHIGCLIELTLFSWGTEYYVLTTGRSILWLDFLHDQPWVSPWIKLISNELSIIIHVIMSQLCLRQQSIVTSSAKCKPMCEDRRGLVLSRKQRNNVCNPMTNSLCAHSSVISQLGK